MVILKRVSFAAVLALEVQQLAALNPARKDGSCEPLRFGHCPAAGCNRIRQRSLLPLAPLSPYGEARRALALGGGYKDSRW